MVRWKENAMDRLADIYVKEPTPAARDLIDRCVQRINHRLALDPWSPGEDRGPNHRVWFTPPLMVSYYLPPGGGVIVYHVTRTKADVDDDG